SSQESKRKRGAAETTNPLRWTLPPQVLTCSPISTPRLFLATRGRNSRFGDTFTRHCVFDWRPFITHQSFKIGPVPPQHGLPWTRGVLFSIRLKISRLAA